MLHRHRHRQILPLLSEEGFAFKYDAICPIKGMDVIRPVSVVDYIVSYMCKPGGGESKRTRTVLCV